VAGDVAPAQLNAVDFLLAVDDGSRVGALQFRDEAGVFQRAAEPGRRPAPPLLELPTC
jgi:serine/threonine-protein kinase HipA